MSLRVSLPKGRCIAGIHSVREALHVRPKAVRGFWLREKFQENPDLKSLEELARSLQIQPQLQPVAVFEKILQSHQGVIAFVDEDPQLDWSKVESKSRSTLLLLDEVSDPHNLGAVLRTAWLIGADGVLIPAQRSAPLSPAACKVAEGAVEHIPVVEDSGWVEEIKRLKLKGFWALGMSHRATQSLYQTEIPEKVIWLLGSEAKGLRKPLEAVCDQLISIPQSNKAASYNVSVAAALALGETFRQRGNSL